MLASTELSDGVKKGIQNADKLLKLWRHRRLSDRGAEYMLTVEIARVLYKSQKKHCGYVDIEESPKAVLEEYEISPEGLPEDLRYNGLIDVVIRDKKQKPRILIEVKKHYKDIKADVTCIARLLHLIPPADVRYGAIAFVRNLRRNEVCTAEEAVRCECERL
jgi:hypothetical protein